MSTTKKLCTSVSLHVYNINCGVHVYKKNLDVWHRNLFVGMVKMYTLELMGQWLHDLSIIKRFLKKIYKLSYLYHNLICRQQKKLCTSMSVHVYNRNCGIHVYKKSKTCKRCTHNYQTCTHNFQCPRVHKFPKPYMYISSLVHLIGFLKRWAWKYIFSGLLNLYRWVKSCAASISS